MPRVVFTPVLQRHVDCADCQVDGGDVRQTLDSVFSRYPSLRTYLVDEQGALRKHVAIFVDGQTVRDRSSLTDSVRSDSEVYVMQALSGG